MFFEAPAIGGYAPIRWSRRAIARQAIRAPIALFRPLGSIRAFSRPISPSGLNTGFWSPYFARWAQYGLLVALFRPLGSIRALARLCAHMRCAHTPRFLRSAAPSDTHAIPRFLRSAAPSH